MLNGHKQNKLIFNKYKLKSLIHSSDFGLVYEGINEKENIPVAIKLEKKIGKYNMLESEAFLLMNLKGHGIPKVITFGHHGSYNVLIEELLGLSIGRVFQIKRLKKFSLKDICMIALQALDRLEFIHSKLVIHRDIKPFNFVIGKEDPELIYLIDFGLSHKYKSSRTGKHIQFKNLRLTYGSLRYLSINGNKGYEQSRRDDLESLGYMLVYLATGYLPWLKAENLDIETIKKYIIVYKMKKSIATEKLCAGLPKEMATYLNYCKELYFEQDPDYNYLRSLFYLILCQKKQKNDLKFVWISKKHFKTLKQENIHKKNNKRSVSPHTRLLNKIKVSLERNKSVNQIRSKNNKSNSIYNMSLNFLYKENDDNNTNEKDIVSENELTVTSKKNITSESTREKDLKRIQKNSSDSTNKKVSIIKRNIKENKMFDLNNLEIKKQNNISKSPIYSKSSPIFSNEKNKILFYPNKEFNDMKIYNNSNNEFNNSINKISTNLNNNSKDLITDKNLETNFNKEINKENKDEKIIRKNKFISDNNFWDNNTGNLIEENCYYSNQYATKDKFNKLNQNIDKNIINNININNNLMYIIKERIIKNINNECQKKNAIFSNKFINNIQTKKFNSRNLNSLKKNNFLNKGSNFRNNISINSRNDTNNLKLINKKEYYNIEPNKSNYNLEVNKIKSNNLFEYINSSNNNYNYMNDVNQNCVNNNNSFEYNII